MSFSPSAPNLALLDCETNRVLCNAWVAGPPAIWHITVPPTEGSPTNIRISSLNSSTTTAADIVALHADQTWLKRPLYEGALHPMDGILAKIGVLVPLGYALWAFSVIPSWGLMLAISLGSRTFMSVSLTVLLAVGSSLTISAGDDGLDLLVLLLQLVVQVLPDPPPGLEISNGTKVGGKT